MSNAPMVPYYYISGNITFIFLTISILIINVLPGSAEQINLDIGFIRFMLEIITYQFDTQYWWCNPLLI